MSSFFVQFINLLVGVLYIAMIGRVLVSWFNIGPSSPFFPAVNVLYQITEPILAPIRRVLPRFGMLDLSPMVALFLIMLVQNFIISRLV